MCIVISINFWKHNLHSAQDKYCKVVLRLSILLYTQQINTLTEYIKVNVKVKVLVCEKPIVFAIGKTKQEVTVEQLRVQNSISKWEIMMAKLVVQPLE